MPKTYEYVGCSFCFLDPREDPDTGFSVIEVPDVGPVFLCGRCLSAFDYGREHPEAEAVFLERDGDVWRTPPLFSSSRSIPRIKPSVSRWYLVERGKWRVETDRIHVGSYTGVFTDDDVMDEFIDDGYALKVARNRIRNGEVRPLYNVMRYY